MKHLSIIISSLLLLTACSENYSNGERIGLITQFSKTGVIWKSWEGHLNLTQTGMNSSSSAPFDFSIDNDNEDPDVIKRIDSAANFGWKVKLVYHETAGKNWFHNRGETSHFVTACEVLDRNPIGNLFNGHSEPPQRQGRIIDTIYLVIWPDRDAVKGSNN